MPSDLWRTVFAGLATAVVFLGGASALAEQGPVRAESGGIAIGGNAEYSCIGDCAVRPEQFQELIQELRATRQQSADLSDAQKKIIAGLERDLALNKQQVQTALQSAKTTSRRNGSS